MNHPTLSAAANAIGIHRTTLIDQLHRLEADIGETLYHRATSDGQPINPPAAAQHCSPHPTAATFNTFDPNAPGSRAFPKHPANPAHH